MNISTYNHTPQVIAVHLGLCKADGTGDEGMSMLNGTTMAADTQTTEMDMTSHTAMMFSSTAAAAPMVPTTEEP